MPNPPKKPPKNFGKRFGGLLNGGIKHLAPRTPTYIKNVLTSAQKNEIAVSVGTGVDDGTDTVSVEIDITELWELYRKVSYAIVTQTASYEVPPDWDDTELSPTWPSGLPDPLEPWFRQERVHEIGYIDKDKKIYKEKFYVTKQAGPIGAFSAVLTAVVAVVDDFVPLNSRIPHALLSSNEAQTAIAQAQSEL